MLNIIEHTEDIDLLDHINQFIIIIHHIQSTHILLEDIIAMVDMVELVDIEDGDSILLIYTFTF